MTSSEHRILDGKYRLVRKLEDGGMGSVWFAEHLSLHSPVAVKLVAKEVAETEEGRQRFMREARTAASLRSPHVVQILDYGVDADTPYIVMELLDGESLADRLGRLGRLSLKETELILRHVGRAVGRAHDAGIVHRDLKPANIFLVQNDDEEVVKLLDFGIAKATLEALSASIASNTRTGAFLGTPFYVSPQQAEGIKTLDHRTDIWSMGVIAFECVVGRQPFTGDTFGSLVLSICTRPMPVPSQHADVPAGFDQWFARACAREPDERFQSAREAATEFRRVAEERAVEATLPAEPAHPAHEPRFHGEPGIEEAAARRQPFASATTSSLGNTTAAASSSAVTARMNKKPRRRWSAFAALAAALLVAASFAWQRSDGSVDSSAIAGAPELPIPEPAAPKAEPPRTVAEPLRTVAEASPAASGTELVEPQPAAPSVALVLDEPSAKKVPAEPVEVGSKADPRVRSTSASERPRTESPPPPRSKAPVSVKAKPGTAPSVAAPQKQPAEQRPADSQTSVPSTSTRSVPSPPSPKAQTPPAATPQGKKKVDLGI